MRNTIRWKIRILWILAICLSLMMSEISNVNADYVSDRLENSPRHHEWVDIPAANGHVVRAYLIFPEVKDPATSVVVIHENRGLTDWVRFVGDELAAHGFVAICPDLLSGTGPDGGGTKSFPSSDDARKAIYGLDANQVTADLKAVTEYVRGLPSTTDKVAVAGFCWGGAQTFRFATNEDSLMAAFVFYGRPPEKQDMSRIACPVYGFYGETDERINSTIEDTQEAMEAAGKTYAPVIYSGVGHAFLRRGTGEGAGEVEKTATQDAWKRLLKLFNSL
ncbi:MAG: dienelactone hydrolase family protein [Candidatus Poribacteria bacterium]|nr:dienelactone hydrolase family protein [Candidatus Poribacteria bacterium]